MNIFKQEEIVNWQFNRSKIMCFRVDDRLVFKQKGLIPFMPLSTVMEVPIENSSDMHVLLQSLKKIMATKKEPDTLFLSNTYELSVINWKTWSFTLKSVEDNKKAQFHLDDMFLLIALFKRFKDLK